MLSCFRRGVAKAMKDSGTRSCDNWNNLRKYQQNRKGHRYVYQSSIFFTNFLTPRFHAVLCCVTQVGKRSVSSEYYFKLYCLRFIERKYTLCFIIGVPLARKSITLASNRICKVLWVQMNPLTNSYDCTQAF